MKNTLRRMDARLQPRAILSTILLDDVQQWRWL